MSFSYYKNGGTVKKKMKIVDYLIYPITDGSWCCGSTALRSGIRQGIRLLRNRKVSRLPGLADTLSAAPSLSLPKHPHPRSMRIRLCSWTGVTKASWTASPVAKLPVEGAFVPPAPPRYLDDLFFVAAVERAELPDPPSGLGVGAVPFFPSVMMFQTAWSSRCSPSR